jgi:hypothetical protein
MIASGRSDRWPESLHRAVAVRAERADPLVAVMPSLKANVDVALTGVGLEQIEHE